MASTRLKEHWATFKASFRAFWPLVGSNAFATLSVVLAGAFLILLAATLLGTVPPPEFQAAGARIVIAVGYATAIISWIVGQLIRLGWPQVALICFVVALLSSGLHRLFGQAWRRTRRLKLGEVEVELSPESAQRLAQTAEEAFKSYRDQANQFIRHQVNIFDIRAHFQEAIRDDRLISTKGKIAEAAGFRCTLYIKDVLFEDTLYQLLDYYPSEGVPTAGRTFSSRFGIIGRAWRCGKNLGEENVETARDVLVEQWGMTLEEAGRGSRKRPSYICAVLRAPMEDGTMGIPIGVMFADSEGTKAFGDKAEAERVAARFAEIACARGLSSKLKDLHDELLRYSATIETKN